MTVTINQDISIESPNTALLNGTVSNPASATGVEIFDNLGNDLGPAALDRSGAWTFDAFFDPSVYLNAVSTDTSGNKDTSDTFGILTHDPLQGQIESVSFGDGEDAYSVFSNHGRPLYDGNVSGQSNADAIDTVYGRGGAGIAFTNTDLGREIIENFRVGGQHHDTLNLADSGLHTLAQVLRQTTMNAGSATIHTDNNTSVTLTGITKHEIALHRQDFVFTGGNALPG